MKTDCFFWNRNCMGHWKEKSTFIFILKMEAGKGHYLRSIIAQSLSNFSHRSVVSSISPPSPKGHNLKSSPWLQSLKGSGSSYDPNFGTLLAALLHLTPRLLRNVQALSRPSSHSPQDLCTAVSSPGMFFSFIP